MNKWQIICPVASVIIVMLVIGVIHERNEERGFIYVATHSIGYDLITATNSTHLVRIDPDLRKRLSELLSSPVHIASVLLGDERSPIGGGNACSRLVLTNDIADGVEIRLRRADNPKMFQVLGYSRVIKHSIQ